MRKNWLKLLIATGGITALLAGCGTNDGESETSKEKSIKAASTNFSESNPLKFVEDTQKNERIWYLINTDGNPLGAKDNEIEGAIVSKDGKVSYYDNLDDYSEKTIDSRASLEGEEPIQLTIGDISKLEKGKAYNAIVDLHKKVYERKKEYRLEASEAYKDTPNETPQLPTFINKIKEEKYAQPLAEPITTRLYTDPTGNNIEKEFFDINYQSINFISFTDEDVSKEVLEEGYSTEEGDVPDKTRNRTKEEIQKTPLHEEFELRGSITVAPTFQIYDKFYAGYYFYRKNYDETYMIVTETVKNNNGKNVTSLDDSDLPGAKVK